MSSSRFALSIALLAMVLAALALGADFAMTRAVSHSEALAAGRLARMAEQRDIDEIPIFGASKAGANYVPAVLGPRFYNYGLESASPDVVNMLLEMELAKPSRQPVVIDLVQWAFRDMGDPRNYLLLTDRESTRAMMRRAGKWRWYYQVPGLRYFGSWDWYAKGLLTDRIALTRRIERGYEVKLDEEPWIAAQFARDVERRKAMELRWSIDPAQKARLLQLIGSAPQRQFVLVLSPLHKSFFTRASGEAEFREELAGMARQAPNLAIIDMTRADYPDTLFLNTAHLNQAGARAFSADLRRELERRGILPAPQ